MTLPATIVGRDVSDFLVTVDVDNKTGVIGERQRVALFVGGVGEGRALVIAVVRIQPQAQRKLFQPFLSQTLRSQKNKSLKIV